MATKKRTAKKTTTTKRTAKKPAPRFPVCVEVGVVETDLGTFQAVAKVWKGDAPEAMDKHRRAAIFALASEAELLGQDSWAICPNLHDSTIRVETYSGTAMAAHRAAEALRAAANVLGILA